MKCTQEQFEAVKGKLEGLKLHSSLYDFFKYEDKCFVTNDYDNIGKISSTLSPCSYGREVHETWNEKVFLEACGIEVEEKFEITKEQLQTIEADGCTYVKEWFPEAFKKELVVGKWYVVKNIACGSQGFSGIGQYTEEPNQSGLCDSDKGYNFKEASGRIWRTNGNVTEATNEEVETALIAEAKKRGFKEGVFIKDFISKHNYGTNKKEFNRQQVSDQEFRYNNKYGFLFIGSLMIFNNGIWAEIIPTITKAEAEKRLGVKIE